MRKKLAATVAFLFWASMGLIGGELAPIEARTTETLGNSGLEAYSCGRNALYIFCLLNGHQSLTLEDMAHVPVTPEGTSILQIQKAAEVLGLKGQLRQYQLDQIDHINLPAIVPFSQAHGELHHYYVLYKLTRTHLYLIDPANGLTFTSSRSSRLSNTWSGVAFNLKERTLPFHTSTETYLWCAILLFEILLLSSKGALSRPREKREAGHSIAMFTILCMGIGAINSEAARSSPVESWRTPQRSAANVLYCYLSILQKPHDYNTLLRMQESICKEEHPSALDLAALLEKCGRPVQVSKLNVEDLSNARLPLITHLDGETPDLGNFVIILGISASSVDVFDGGNAIVQRIRLEDFKRSWSQFGLISKTPWHKRTLRSMFAFTIGAFIPFLVYRTRQSKS